MAHAVDTDDTDDNGRVTNVTADEVITNPRSKRAVQIPPEADGTTVDALAAHEEPTPNEAYDLEPERFQGSSDASSDEQPSSSE